MIGWGDAHSNGDIEPCLTPRKIGICPQERRLPPASTWCSTAIHRTRHRIRYTSASADLTEVQRLRRRAVQLPAARYPTDRRLRIFPSKRSQPVHLRAPTPMRAPSLLDCDRDDEQGLLISRASRLSADMRASVQLRCTRGNPENISD